MSSPSPITIAGLVLVVLLIFNLMIFVHELGHFLAARWRGMYVDRFQIWFGKPIWSKTLNGVKYGLGWIPAGGFVSLPQMAPMEAIEGQVSEEVKEMKPPSPLDKIIVAFAGPLFSLLLALLFACVVWKVGKPDYQMQPVVGYVVPDMPAAESGLQPGDRILEVNGEPVDFWAGDMRGVTEKIMLTETDRIRFKVERDGEVVELESEYEIPESKWYERKKLPQIGIAPAMPAKVAEVSGNSPAALAGITGGDFIVAINGREILHPAALSAASKKGETLEISIKKADGSEEKVSIEPVVPESGSQDPLIGISGWDTSAAIEDVMLHPTPFEQVGQSLNWMRITIQKVTSSSSNVGVDQLAGPVGIGKTIFSLLLAPNGILLVLWFSVLLNVNLAVMNMLPVPVLDGGHIVMSTLEWIRGRPVSARFLEVVQTFFALCLMGFMLFVTVKDVGSLFGDEEEDEPVKFAAPAAAEP